MKCFALFVFTALACTSRAATIKYTITGKTLGGLVTGASTGTFFGYGADQRIPAGLNITVVITLDSSKRLPYPPSQTAGYSGVKAVNGNSPVTDTTIYLETSKPYEPYDLGPDTFWASQIELVALPKNQSLSVTATGADFNFVKLGFYSADTTAWPTIADWTQTFIYGPSAIPANTTGEFSVYTRSLGVSGAFTLTGILVSGIGGSEPNPACPVANYTQVRVDAVEFQNPDTGIEFRPYMKAKFTTPGSSTLSTYAHTCGFSYFTWQQQITSAPGGDTVRPNDPLRLLPANIAPDGSLVAPPSFYDPPPGGYVDGIDSYPFYYPLSYLRPRASCILAVAAVSSSCPPNSNNLPYVVSAAQNVLSFGDAAGHNNLSGLPPSKNPTGNYLAFLTTLVGVSAKGTIKCGTNNPYYCTPLYSWTWNSTFSPAMNSGGITITSINGVIP